MAGMKMEIHEAMKHKWVKYGLYVLAAVGIVIVARRFLGGSAASSNAQATSDQTQLDLQAQQISAQTQSQQAAINAQASAQAESDQTALSALNIESAEKLAESQGANATTLAMGNIQLQGLQAQLTNAATMQSEHDQASVSLANIQATEATNISNNSTQAQIAALNAEAQQAAQTSANQLAAEQSSNAAQVAIAQAQSGGGGGGCFITTAVCRAKGLPDDCEQLTVLRAFRDSVLRQSAHGRIFVQAYYGMAPLVVARIDALAPPLRDTLYARLESYLAAIVRMIHSGFYNDAYTLYLAMIEAAVQGVLPA